MPLRFQSQLQIDLLPDEAVENRFEVIMPSLQLISAVKLRKSSIKAKNLLNGGLTRAIGSVISGGALTKYIPIVEEITFGPYNFKTDFTRINTFYFGKPVDREAIKNVTLTMFLDSGLLAWYYMQSWKDLVFNEEYEYYYPPQNYKKDVIIVVYGLGGITPVAQFTLKGCFPIETTPFNFTYANDNPKRLRLTCTLNVDRLDLDYNKANSAIVSTLASGNPLGYATDQLLAQTSLWSYGQGNTGWNDSGSSSII